MSIVAFHACARFGLGAAPDELKAIGNDPRGWLLAQLEHPLIPAGLQHLQGGEELMGEQLKSLKRKTRDKSKMLGLFARKLYMEHTGARFAAQVQSQQPFIERLVLFWSNHFTVSIQKGKLVALVNLYELQAIRPHVTGYFKDMLLAVCQHPAMLYYLDNSLSLGPNSVAGNRSGRGRNENLAREILELHTLGVNGGYTQQDVIALANIITGWSLDNDGDGPIIRYKFKRQSHEPGEKLFLGKRFAEGGEQEGIDALTMLATHPSTAQHIATKLARHFITDNPPPAAVAALARSFLDSGGHLPTVMRTLIALDESWLYPLAKLKNSYEFAVSACRLTGIIPTAQKAVNGLEALNYRAFNASSPAGYDDIASTWSAPDAIMKRIEWGHRLALHLRGGTNPMQLAQAGLGDALSDATRQQIQRAPSGADGIALVLASPEFQRR